MDLVRAYSKRPDLLDDLDRAARRQSEADHASGRPPDVSMSDRSTRPWRVCDRLTGDDIRMLVEQSQAGTPRHELAERYGISGSSIKRLLRRW